MLTLAREFLCEVVPEVGPLLEQHYLELARNRDRVALSPDWERYALLESAGILRIFTARKNGVLVGYSAFLVNRHLHYVALTNAHNDVLFVRAEHRTGRTGMRLIEFCEQQLEQEFDGGDLSIAWHAKPDTDLQAILSRRGYGVQDVIYTRLSAAQG